MPLLGAHMSIAGGLHRAVEAAAALGMDTVQIFTHSPSQWAIKPAASATVGGNEWHAPPLPDDAVRLFRQTFANSGLQKPCAHNSYLINVASPNNELWRKSLAALACEVERAEALGLDGVVMHPGSHVEASVEAGLQRIIQALDEVHRRTAGVRVQLWLETTAGQGTNLGHRFEHLSAIYRGVRNPERLGVCVDTCHIFAAGYPLQSFAEYTATFQEFDDIVGIKQIRVFHLNDSQKPLGSRVDRHAHIGEGCLGLEPFRHVLNDSRFAALPMYLETEKGERHGEDLDAINLRTLRSLMATDANRPQSPSGRRNLARGSSRTAVRRSHVEPPRPLRKRSR